MTDPKKAAEDIIQNKERVSDAYRGQSVRERVAADRSQADKWAYFRECMSGRVKDTR